MLVFLEVGIVYLDFVLSSGVSLGVSLGVALALATATGPGRTRVPSTAERARLVGDAALVAALFSIELAFLALYHALWVDGPSAAGQPCGLDSDRPPHAAAKGLPWTVVIALS